MKEVTIFFGDGPLGFDKSRVVFFVELPFE